MILSYRHANDWARSVLRWRDLASRMLACGTIPNTTLPAMARAYTTYVADTQAYWLQHRWHHFVFLDIESKLAGRQLQRVYGIPASCWGHFNANLRPT